MSWPRESSSRAFTLIEMSIVIVAMGMFIAVATHARNIYAQSQHQAENYTKLKTLSLSLSLDYGQEKRYPCPADATVSIRDMNGGAEDCSLLDPLIPTGSCTASGGICKVAGARDVDADGNPDPVLVGGVPYRTLKMHAEDRSSASLNEASMTDTLDAGGFQITYVVTAVLAQPAASQPAGVSGYGAIRIVTEDGASLTSDAAGNAHYALIIHGTNHKGARTADGQMPFPCTPGTKDAENCNIVNGTIVDGLHNIQPGTSYYDDTILYSDYILSQIWDFTTDGKSLYALNKGNVGVGITDLNQLRNGPRLNVMGPLQIKGPGSELIMSGKFNRYIDDATAWSPSAFGGEPGSVSCGADPGNYAPLLAVKNGQAVCDAQTALPAPASGQECPAGNFMKGVNADGTIICGPLL